MKVRWLGSGATIFFALNCTAPRPMEVLGTGGSPGSGGASECFCEIEKWEKGIPWVDLGCFCERLGCPSSSRGLLGPSLAKIWTIECNGLTSYGASMELAQTSIYTFEDATGRLIGADLFIDVNVLCDQNDMRAGELLLANNPCGTDWCLRSWGPDQVAPPGTCLDPSKVTDPRDRFGLGGAGGTGGVPSSLGGSAGSGSD